MRRVVTMLALAALAGCSRGDEPGAGDNRAAAAIEAAVAQNGAAATAAEGLPVVPKESRVDSARQFPTGFLGYWGRVPADCELANADAHGRIAIDGGTVRLFDENARVTRATRATPTEFIATMTFAGDGARRMTSVAWTLVAGGTRLVRTDAGAPAITYQRC